MQSMVRYTSACTLQFTDTKLIVGVWVKTEKVVITCIQSYVHALVVSCRASTHQLGLYDAWCHYNLREWLIDAVVRAIPCINSKNIAEQV